MKVGELCTRTVIVAWREESVLEVARRMRSGHVGDVVLVVGEPGHCIPVGLVTDRDLVVAALAQVPEHLGALALGDIAVRPLATIKEEEDVDVAISVMRREGVHRLPVIAEDGQLVGILSRDDILELLAEQMNQLATIPERGARAERAERL